MEVITRCDLDMDGLEVLSDRDATETVEEGKGTSEHIITHRIYYRSRYHRGRQAGSSSSSTPQSTPPPLAHARPCLRTGWDAWDTLWDAWARLCRVWTIGGRGSAAYAGHVNSDFLPVGYRG